MDPLKQDQNQENKNKLSKRAGLILLVLSPMGLGMIWIASSALNHKTLPSSNLSKVDVQESARESARGSDSLMGFAPNTSPTHQTAGVAAITPGQNQNGQLSQSPASSLSVGLPRNQTVPNITPPQPTLPPSQANSTTSNGGAVPASLPTARMATEGCFEITFKHKKVSSHSDGEVCLQHQNLITLQHPKLGLMSALNPASVCIEVNGEVVKHKKVAGHPDQILIGPEAGPNATITARACIGKSQCTKKCILKTDHFMSALGMEENHDQTKKVGWSGSTQETQEDIALAKEVKEAHALLNHSTDSDTDAVFNGWTADQYADLKCGKGGSYAENKGIKLTQSANNSANR